MIDVPRCDSVPFQEPPLTWRPYRRQDGTRGALFTCPEGHTASLEGWTIAADGAVSPSVDCTPNGCSFHDYVRLVDWEGPWCPCRVHGDPDGETNYDRSSDDPDTRDHGDPSVRGDVPDRASPSPQTRVSEPSEDRYRVRYDRGAPAHRGDHRSDAPSGAFVREGATERQSLPVGLVSGRSAPPGVGSSSAACCGDPGDCGERCA